MAASILYGVATYFYYEKVRRTMHTAIVEDTKLLRKTVKYFHSNKGNLGQNIKLVEENELPQNDKKIADEVNSFFKSATPNLEK